MKLRPPKVEEYPALSDLCLRSKGHWGYDEAFLEACRAELTLSADHVDAELIRVADDTDGQVAGLVQISLDGEEADLEKLFIDPARIGGGVGRLLFDWAAYEALARGARRMIIDADPDAAPFYRKLGAIDCGTVPSGSIPGRVLPRLVFHLEARR